MKIKMFTFLFLSSLPGIAWGASAKVECLDKAKTWFYTNTSDGDSAAKAHAIDFCSKNGSVECLDEASAWFYSNTSDGSSAARDRAILFCADNHK